MLITKLLKLKTAAILDANGPSKGLKLVPKKTPMVKVKVKVPILIVEHRAPELIPNSRQSACR